MAALLLTACESSVDMTSDDEGGGSSDPSSTEPVTSDPGGTADPAFAGIKWKNTNVSTWKQTTTLKTSVGGGKITLDYDKARVWPGIDNVNANAWVIFMWKEQRYASTFDYLRPGQTVKSADFHIPMDGGEYRPSSGEVVGFMVSGLARDSRRNVYERSQIDYIVWP